MACGERVLKKLAQAERALSKLKEIKELEGKLDEEILYEVSAKRFEYTYEAIWKTARLYLLEEKGLECNSPMDCFKSLYSVGLISDSKAQNLPSIVRKRNEVVHIYDFSIAQDVYLFVKERVLPVFEEIVLRLKTECEGGGQKW